MRDQAPTTGRHLDLAAEEWAPLVGTMSKANLGTLIHHFAKQLMDEAKRIDPIRYKDVHSEVSLDLQPSGDPLVIGVPYGTTGSTRLDVMELVSPQFGCVYDYKTGQAGLTAARLLQIALVWNIRFPGVPFVIIEMRQANPVWSE